MTGVDEQVAAVEEALRPLDQGFAADGAGLAVSRAGSGIEVRLVLTDESCADCIVEPPVLRAIVSDQLAQAGVAQEVRLLDPRE